MKRFAFAPKQQNGENNGEEPHRVKISRVLIAVFTVLISLSLSYIPFYFVIFDYGYIGMLAPVLLSLFDFSKIRVPDKIKRLDSVAVRLVFLTAVCIALAVKNQNLNFNDLFGIKFNVQLFNLLSIPLLALYNGRVGVKKLKYFFYAFYPVHLGIIMAIKMILQAIAK